jgi:AcrR family transcriptional regulator
VAASVDASAAPVRERGLRTRAGNAMGRTRVAVVDGAVRAVEKHGSRRATMGDIATLAGVAKGTLYNHFRTKESVYAAAVETGVNALVDECTVLAHHDLAEALAVAAERLGTHPALRRIADDEPAVVATLTRVGSAGAWGGVRDGVGAVLAAAGCHDDPAAVELVLRWLVSFVATPARDVEAQAVLVAAGLRARAGQGT